MSLVPFAAPTPPLITPLSSYRRVVGGEGGGGGVGGGGAGGGGGGGSWFLKVEHVESAICGSMITVPEAHGHTLESLKSQRHVSVKREDSVKPYLCRPVRLPKLG